MLRQLVKPNFTAVCQTPAKPAAGRAMPPTTPANAWRGRTAGEVSRSVSPLLCPLNLISYRPIVSLAPLRQQARRAQHPDLASALPATASTSSRLIHSPYLYHIVGYDAREKFRAMVGY